MQPISCQRGLSSSWKYKESEINQLIEKSFLLQEYEHALKFYRRGERHSREINRNKFLAGIRICKKKILKDLNAILIMDNEKALIRNINQSMVEVEFQYTVVEEGSD